MVLQAKALVTGLALASGLLFAATSKAKAKGGTSSGASSAGNTTPSGADPGRLADLTTQSLIRQDIAGLRTNIQSWSDAGDPLTAGALQFVLDSSIGNQQLVEWTNDGNAGSPMLRAFGDRVLLLEGRPEKLNLWADAWESTLPGLAAGLRAKAQGIDPSSHAGTTDDPVPNSDLLQRIGEVVASGDSGAMRELADELDKAGFPEQAADLRAAADMLDKGQATVPPVQVPASTSSSASLPSTSGRTYTVKSGDNPSKIALALTGNANRWTELVAANVPPKKKASNGNFATLNPGEVLKIPASWPATSLPNVSAPVAPATSSAPSAKPASSGSTLQSGSSGPAVSIVQQQLGVSPVDGKFGPQTLAAVKAFQKAHGLTADGIVGPQTQAALAGQTIVVSPVTITAAPPKAGSPTVTASTTGAIPTTATLTIGSSGAAVAALQQKLGVSPADGKYGPQTQAAVKAFQAARGLTADGIAGPKTLAAMNGVFAGEPTYRQSHYSDNNRGETLAHRRIEMAGEPADARQVGAGKIALMAHYGKMPPDLLAEWQKREGIKNDPAGKYGPESAYVLAFRYGIVPPVPHILPANLVQKFVGQMMAAGRKDGARADEFKAVADQAMRRATKVRG